MNDWVQEVITSSQFQVKLVVKENKKYPNLYLPWEYECVKLIIEIVLNSLLMT